ncbi:MAG: hypothetical protein AAF514_03375 [Verrucomicrobiota bacterium]
MKFLLLPIVAGVYFLSSTVADAQASTRVVRKNSPSYESAARNLRGAPAKQYQFSKARMTDVLRLMAEDAGISFFALPNDEADSSRLVTFTINAAPFTALEKLANSYGIALIYDRGVWFMRPSNDSEMIGRSYQIKHNTKERITTSSSAGSSGGSSRGGSSGGGAQSGISLQGETHIFEMEPSKLIDDIKEVLGIPTGGGAFLSADNYLQAMKSLSGEAGGLGAGLPVSGLPSATDPEGAKVIWNSDSNSLYIVATRQQHNWVEGFLASADKPQPMIAVEAKFFETTKDPRNQLGVDWTGTLQNGLNLNVTDLFAEADLNRLKDFTHPRTAILSATDLNVSLNALLRDLETKQVSYPRAVALNNREVVIRSVVNEPVLSSSSSSSLGAGATSTQAVDYLPIGTVINILPRVMQNDVILMNINLTVSSIIGEKLIAGNPYPVATSRIYNSPVQVKSGYTIAIGGLDEANTQNESTQVPGVSKIPVLGNLFKNKAQVGSKKNMMIFITPTVLRGNTRGVPEKVRHYVPNSNRLVNAGRSGNSGKQAPSEFDLTTGHFERDLAHLEMLASEGRGRRPDYEHADYIYNHTRRMSKVTKALRRSGADDPMILQERLAALERVTARAKKVRSALWHAK